MKLIAHLKYILYILLFLFSSQILGQEFNISGSVVDTQKVPIAYANVLLLAEDESIVTGTSSLENGSFNLSKLEAKTYTLKVTFVGYKDFIKVINLSGDQNVVSIVLEENTESLKEVTITSAKPTLKKEADRLIFNVANTALSEGNLLEVLRSTPGVLILDNNITVKNSAPTVYINDRKVNLSSSEVTQLLENSPANTIKKVEVITNPSAKYDAESGAVINIVMSRNLITGYRGNIFTNYTQGVFPRYNLGLNQFYKTKKININLNYSFTKSKINRENYDRINYLESNGDLNEKWETNNNRNTRSNTHNVNLNFDYFLNKENTLSFSANTLIIPFYDYRIKGQTIVTNATGDRLFNFNSINHSEDEKYNLGFNLDFVHRFENKSKLAFNTHKTLYNYNRDQNVMSDYFVANAPNFITAFTTQNSQKIDLFTSQLDYVLPINEGSQFDAGIKSSFIKTDSDFNQSDIFQTNGQTPGNINTYNYEESIFAAYASYAKQWGKWSFNGGLRVEQTNIDGISVSDNIKNTQDYFEVFPTLNLSIKASENTSIYTNYKRSISRPSYRLLNPFNFFLNDNTVVAGNPVLKPSFINKFLLGTGLYDFLTVEVFFKANKDAVYQIPIQDNTSNMITFTPTNINKSNEYGLDIEFYKSISNRWFIYLANSLSNTEEQLTTNSTEIRRNKWYNYSVLSTDYSFLKDNSLSVNFTVTRIGENIVGLQTVDALFVSNISIRKKLFNKRASLSLFVSDFFNKEDYGVTNRYLNQDSYTFNDEDTRYIKLGFNYKFGNTTLKTNERVKQLNERERLEK